MVSSKVYSNRVGVAASGEVLITGSTISNNSSDGVTIGMGASGSATVENSVISGNGDDGLVSAGPYNPFTFTTLGCPPTSVQNTTISGNGGNSIRIFATNFSADSLTVSGNEWGFSIPPPACELNLSNSIFNSTATGFDFSFPYGLTVTSNHNLFGDSSKSLGQFMNDQLPGVLPSPTDITATSDGTNPTVLAAILDTNLSGNGGETQTHALISGSPAIDAASSGPGLDQRGVYRPQGAAFDIGAYEYELISSFCNGLVATVDLNLGQLPTSGDDVILGTAEADTINALGGNDVICGFGGNDTINAGGGNDWVDGGAGNDDILGSAGDDTLFGGLGDDVIRGGSGDDEIYGEEGDDSLMGQPGNDLIEGGVGIDDINGGGGNDTIYTGTGATVTSGVFVSGSGGNDTIYGGPDADDIKGSNGADTIFGEGGDDVITGGNGQRYY
jgi:Ca2+-binding RTX toxin-like protein